MKRHEFIVSALTLLIPKKLFSIFEPFFYPKKPEVWYEDDGSDCDGGFLVPKSMHSELLWIIEETPPISSAFDLPPLHPNCRCSTLEVFNEETEEWEDDEGSGLGFSWSR